jgi:murein DD-endopeptidase
MCFLMASIIFSALFFNVNANTQASQQTPKNLILDTYASPMPIGSNGKYYLAYEVHITNTNANPILLKKAEAFNPLNKSESFASMEGEMLRENTIQLGLARADESVLTLRPGCRAIVLFTLEIAGRSGLPEKIHHLFQWSMGEEKNNRLWNSEGGIIEISKRLPRIIGSPVKGKYWLALNTFDYAKYGHRGSINGSDSDCRAVNAQAFAIDFLKMDENGKLGLGEKTNEAWLCYGQEILSVEDGVVVRAVDGIPENQPGQRPELPEHHKPGNHVCIDIGDGHFVFYAHLKTGSVRIKEGDRVKKGDVIGLIGNSGRSDGPHLHFHIADSREYNSQSLPFLFGAYEFYDKYTFEEVIEGRPLKIIKSGRIKNESPLNGTVLGF